MLNEQEEVFALVKRAMENAGFKEKARLELADNLGDFVGIANTTGPIVHEFHPKWSLELIYPIGTEKRSARYLININTSSFKSEKEIEDFVIKTIQEQMK